MFDNSQRKHFGTPTSETLENSQRQRRHFGVPISESSLTNVSTLSQPSQISKGPSQKKHYNAGNLENEASHAHIVELNKEVADHYKAANVKLSDFKPTQNVWKGHEKELDPVLTAGDLGKDEFFTKVFERQNNFPFNNSTFGNGNKGNSIANIESSQLKQKLEHKQEDVA